MGDEELAAPGELEHLRCFVNTRDLELGTEQLATPADLEAWLAGRGLIRPDEVAGPLDRAIAVREAFRALLLAHATGDPAPPAAVAMLERAGRSAQLRPDGDLRLAPAGPDAGLARLLAIAVVAHADGTWRRLKACPGEACQWALYDRTRSRTRTWCAAAKCGARTRSREYRRRQRANGSSSATNP
jgi:predicted RNA-binding Zn ribbon-like protein